MAEKWNNGFEIQTMSDFKNCMRDVQIKLGLIPSNPVFHHSIIPVSHYIDYVKIDMFHFAKRINI